MADVRSELTVAATEAQIAVHWKEEEYLYPSAQFIAQANMADPSHEPLREKAPTPAIMPT